MLQTDVDTAKYYERFHELKQQSPLLLPVSDGQKIEALEKREDEFKALMIDLRAELEQVYAAKVDPHRRHELWDESYDAAAAITKSPWAFKQIMAEYVSRVPAFEEKIARLNEGSTGKDGQSVRSRLIALWNKVSTSKCKSGRTH